MTEVILDLAPKFRVYGIYVNNFKIAMDTLQEYLLKDR